MNTVQAMMVFSMMTSTIVIGTGFVFAANPNTDDPSGWGKLTSGAAKSDGSAFGEHASSQDTPRLGLGNVLGEITNNPDASKHPSELGQFLCANNPGIFPCP